MGKHAFSPTDALSELSSVSATTLVVRVDRQMLFEGCGDGATARAARPATHQPEVGWNGSRVLGLQRAQFARSMLHRLIAARPAQVTLQCAYLTLEAEVGLWLSAGTPGTTPGMASDDAIAAVESISKTVLSASASSAANLLLWHTYAQAQVLHGRLDAARGTYAKVLGLAHKVPPAARVDAPRAVLALADTWRAAAVAQLSGAGGGGDGGGVSAAERATSPDDPVLQTMHALAAAVEPSFTPLAKLAKKHAKALKKGKAEGCLGANVLSRTRVVKARSGFTAASVAALRSASLQVDAIVRALVNHASSGAGTAVSGAVLAALDSGMPAHGIAGSDLVSVRDWAHGVRAGVAPAVHLMACHALFECVAPTCRVCHAWTCHPLTHDRVLCASGTSHRVSPQRGASSTA